MKLNSKRVVSVILSAAMLVSGMSVSAMAATRGDLDNDGIVTSNDAALVYKAVADGTTAQLDLEAADVAGSDGKITNEDAAAIMQYVLRASTVLEPAGEVQEPSVDESNIWWLDEHENVDGTEGGGIAPGTYDILDGLSFRFLEPLDNAATNYTADTGRTYTLDGKKHNGYRNGSRPKNAGQIPNGDAFPTSGSAFLAIPSVDGAITFYLAGQANDYYITTYKVEADGSYTFVESSTHAGGASMSATAAGKAGYAYLATTSTGTNNFLLCGVKFIKDNLQKTAVDFVHNTGVDPEDSSVIIYLTDVDTKDPVEINYASTEVTLNVGHTYSILSNDGSLDVLLDGSSEFTYTGQEKLTFDVNKLDKVTLSGEITFDYPEDAKASDIVTSLTFTSKANPDVNYSFDASSGLTINADNTYSVSIYPGDYTTSAKTANDSYTTYDNVVVERKDTENEIYLENNTPYPYPTAYDPEISVPGDYKTLTEALKAVKAMTRTEDQVVTINFADDIMENVYVDVDNVTFNGNGHSLTWYYGNTAYYYSVTPSTSAKAPTEGLYSERLFRDKYTKNQTSGTYWGGVLVVNAKNFNAQDLTIQNTFSYYVVQEELDDGVEYSKLDRQLDSDVNSQSVRERASAVILGVSADNSEFKNCKILSSQDTLGYNGQTAGHAYFVDCTIGGNVDFICGAGTMVFDDCELQYYEEGYTSPGYLTAPKTNPYIFRGCYVTLSSGKNVNDPTEGKHVQGAKGALGRTWYTGQNGQLTSTAYFIDFNTNGNVDLKTPWLEMNGARETADFYAYNFRESEDGEPLTEIPFTKVYTDPSEDESGLLAKYINDDIIYSALAGWKPDYYKTTGSGGQAPDESTRKDSYVFNLRTVETINPVNSEYIKADDAINENIYNSIFAVASNGTIRNNNSNSVQVAEGNVLYVPAAVGSKITIKYFDYEKNSPNYAFAKVAETAAETNPQEYTVKDGDLTALPDADANDKFYVAVTSTNNNCYIAEIDVDNTGVTE